MIHINLLPVRQILRRQRAGRQLALLVGILFILLASLAGGYLALAQRTSDLHSDIDLLKKKRASYTAILRQIKTMEKEQNELAAKIDIIKKLKTNSQLSVRLLDEIADAVKADSIWLTSLKQADSSLLLAGIAMDNTRLAEFMDTLTASSCFSRATLGRSAMTQVSGHKLKSFSMTLTIDNTSRK